MQCGKHCKIKGKDLNIRNLLNKGSASLCLSQRNTLSAKVWDHRIIAATRRRRRMTVDADVLWRE
jgi:hypothetical protein